MVTAGLCLAGAEATWLKYALTYSTVAEAYAAVGLACLANAFVVWFAAHVFIAQQDD